MRRRDLLAGLAALPLARNGRALAASGAGDHPLARVWAAWKAAHLEASGRVVDGLQGGASHSEGQGYGMVLASALGDETAFDAMLDWTLAHLALRDDALLCWRWLPDAATPVPDRNNASDADLFFAWALMRGADRFDRPTLASRAGATVAALSARCITPWPGQEGRLLLVPGAEGFAIDGGHVINPSYYMLRAMQELGARFRDARLVAAARDGNELLADLARLGPVPDWVEVTAGGLGNALQFSSNAGYESLRVPLWMIWSARPDHPAVARAYAPGSARAVPDGLTATIVDGTTGAVLETSADPGYGAIAALTACAVDRNMGSAMPPFDAAQPYYPATLHLFAYLAQMDVLPECFPI